MRTWQAYLTLTKPGIIMGNAVTMMAGFALASRGRYDGMLFLATFMGLALVIASAGIFNNYFDRIMDAHMERTKKRPLADCSVAIVPALLFGTLLGVLGTWILFFWTNPLTTALAVSGFVIYLFAYGFLKYYTSHGTLIGSIAGAIPPLVGYCAVSNSWDMPASLLFLSVAFWQMPHFYAIAIHRLDDYRAAGIPVLPIISGIRTTQLHMVFYILAFILSSLLLVFTGTLGILFATLSLILELIWLKMVIQGPPDNTSEISSWARKVFLFSLIVIMGICSAIPLDLFFHKLI
jgi:protoheme IX farnesyltransferase